MLCWFLPYDIVNQPEVCVYMCVFLLNLSPTPTSQDHHRAPG